MLFLSSILAATLALATDLQTCNLKDSATSAQCFGCDLTFDSQPLMTELVPFTAITYDAAFRLTNSYGCKFHVDVDSVRQLIEGDVPSVVQVDYACTPAKFKETCKQIFKEYCEMDDGPEGFFRIVKPGLLPNQTGAHLEGVSSAHVVGREPYEYTYTVYGLRYDPIENVLSELVPGAGADLCQHMARIPSNALFHDWYFKGFAGPLKVAMFYDLLGQGFGHDEELFSIMKDICDFDPSVANATLAHACELEHSVVKNGKCGVAWSTKSETYRNAVCYNTHGLSCQAVSPAKKM